MKVRNKNKSEKQHDSNMLDIARRELAEQAATFANEFSECDGDVFYSTYQDFANKAWHYEREKEYSKMVKVGPEWDYDEGICGEHRYRGI